MSREEKEVLKEELERVERKLQATTISIHCASQSKNHMCKAEKYPISSLDIQYSVFFLWETKKSLQSQLSLPISTYCQLVNKSIAETDRTVVQCERLETRLRKESSRIIAKYKTLKGQHRVVFKTKIINILIFKGELTELPAAPKKLQISGAYMCVQGLQAHSQIGLSRLCQHNF